MNSTVNLFTGRDGDFLGSVAGWSVNGPHSKIASREQYKFDSLGSLKIINGSTSTVVLTSPSVIITEEGWDVRAFAWVYAPREVTVVTSVAVETPASVVTTNSMKARANTWTLVTVDGPVPADNSVASVQITFTGLQNGDVTYITSPVLSQPDAISKNIFAAEVWVRMPEYLQDADAMQEDPDYPLLRFIDVNTNTADYIAQLWDTYRYITPEEGGALVPPSLLEPEVANMSVLRWWAQILGINFYDPSTGSGTTSWFNLESGVDVNGDGIPTWDEWVGPAPVSPLDGPDAGSGVSWDELENFAPDVSGLLDLIRWQVRTAYNGLRGGTMEALVQTVKKVLIGTKTVNVTTQVGGDPWKIQISTLSSESPNTPVVPGSDSLILDVIQNTIPAGYEVVHITT